MDTKRQIRFKGIRHNTINVKEYKLWCQRFWDAISYLLLWQISTLECNIQSPESGEYFITETPERKQRQSNHGVNQVSKGIVII